ncbi:Protein-tyrosine phosphatase, partial [Teladorsagia circumcincta]
DVGCLDNNRVVLTLGSCSYIHANYVSTPDNPKKFICTQAPLPATCEEFWCMVVQEEAEVILMLCNFIEQQSKKCAEYYPRKNDDQLVFNEIKVQFKKQEDFAFPFETKIKLEVTHLEVSVPGCAPHSCVHYHWVDWPDRGVPPADAAPLFLLHSFAHIKLTTDASTAHCGSNHVSPLLGTGAAIRNGNAHYCRFHMTTSGPHSKFGEVVTTNGTQCCARNL